MKSLPLLILVLACAGCAEFPDLEGREVPDISSARYPTLIPLEGALGAPVDPINEAAEVEKDLIAQRKELEKKADKLQRAEIN